VSHWVIVAAVFLPFLVLAKQVDGMKVVVVDLDQTKSLMKIDFRHGAFRIDSGLFCV
jgi:hypothetical protein